MIIAESGGPGRARTAPTETNNARAKLSRTRPLPEPVDDPDLLDWTNPGTRIRLINALMADPGPFSFLARRAVAVLEVLINRRNPHTGQLDPSWLNLGAGARYKDRSVAYAVSELRRYGLIASVRRCYGLRPTSCAYVLTCKLLVLAGLVRKHDPDSCAKCRSAAALIAGPRLHNLQTNRDLLLPSEISLPADQIRNKRRGEPRRGGPGIRPPFSKGSGAEENSDPLLVAFLAVFQRERHALYGDNDLGTIGAENRARLSVFLADFVGCAWAWSAQQGLERARVDVATELFEGVVQAWLSMPGTNGFVRERRHPIGLIMGDLDKYGPIAREAWERKQTRPERPAASAAAVGDVTAAAYAEQLQAQAEADEAALPEFDAAELVALAQLPALQPATSPDEAEPPIAEPLALTPVPRAAAAEVRSAPIEPIQAAPEAAPLTGDPRVIAATRAAMAAHTARAARLQSAKAPSVEAVSEAAPEAAAVEPSPSPVQTTGIAPSPTEEDPRKPRGGTELTTGQEAPQEAAVDPPPPRVRRPGSRPFSGTTSAPGVRPDAWRYMARPDFHPVDADADPPDE